MLIIRYHLLMVSIACSKEMFGSFRVNSLLSNARTPLDYAWNLKSPLLMIHSENDKRVVLHESQQMAEMLNNFKIPFEYHVFPGDGHHFRNPNSRHLYTTLIEKFLLKNLPIREEN